MRKLRIHIKFKANHSWEARVAYTKQWAHGDTWQAAVRSLQQGRPELSGVEIVMPRQVLVPERPMTTEELAAAEAAIMRSTRC